jgi:hypothetical protein
MNGAPLWDESKRSEARNFYRKLAGPSRSSHGVEMSNTP